MPTPKGPTKEEHALLSNKLEFLRTHRAKVRGERDAVLVESERPEFTFIIPGVREVRPEVFERFATVYRAPWALEPPGYAKRAALSLMAFEGDARSWRPAPKGFEARLVRDEKDMEAFSEVQARGFCEKEEAYQEWKPFLRAANFRNLRNENQAFYLGYVDRRPVSCCLVVYTPELYGLYAVATLPDARRTGAGAALMARAVADAKSERGFPPSRLTLQVMAGSYAEGFYERLGFKTRYQLEVFSAPRP